MALFDEQRLQDYVSHLPKISEFAGYWFFRTEGGALFEPFITSNSIAIGCPYVDLATLAGIPNDKSGQKMLSLHIRKAEPTDRRPGLTARQLLVFAHRMKQGDFVIIPAWGSHELAIGVLTGDKPFEEPLEFQSRVYSGFQKRRKIRWLKRISRDLVNPNLFKMLFAHQTVTDVSSCSQWIDPLLFDFFNKGQTYHYVISINQADGIKARDLFDVFFDLMRLVDKMGEEMHIGDNSSGLDTRINLNSPGEVELIAHSAQYIFIIAAIVLFFNGGGLRLNVQKLGIHLDISTDGLIKAINQFLNDRANRGLSETVRTKLQRLRVGSSEEVAKVLDHIQKRKP